MLRESSFLIRSKILTDLLLVALIVLITFGTLDQIHSNLSAPSTIILLFISLACWLFSGSAFGLYSDMRLKPYSIEWVIFLKTFGIYTLVTSFIYFQLLPDSVNRQQFLFHCFLVFTILPIQKLAIRVIFKKIKNSNHLMRKVLIVGAGNSGIDFYKRYVNNRHYGLQLTGFLDDEIQPSLNGHYLGKTSEIENVIARHQLDEIVVALPLGSQVQIRDIVMIAERQGKRVRIIPDYQSYGEGKMHVDNMGNLSIITIRSLPLDIVDNKIYKRTFDIVFSLLVILFVMSWLLPIIAIVIKLTTKGPVFFKQERWGLNNKVIVCWKFRSMQKTSRDIDDRGNYQQASKNDPRITKTGRFLRKTNLDELPQFFNVLMGSMSVVGPRPHPVPLNIASKESVDNYMMRHWVKPGITGWAQANGFRGETREPFLMKERVRHDIWYLENWTFWLDLQIIVQTVVNMVKGEKNAC